MNNNTILSWDNADHKAIYSRQLKDNPIYWNEDLNVWVVYSYGFCKAVLLNNDLQIPEPVIENVLNARAHLLVGKLARLNNNNQHAGARQAAMLIYQSMQTVQIHKLLEQLLIGTKDKFDWIAVVAKKLPVLVVLKGLGFNYDDCVFVVENIASLVKIMSPQKTDNDTRAVNNVVNDFYAIAEKNIKSAKFLPGGPTSLNDETVELYICNLVGLFIQCYDAGKGLLTNALINLVSRHSNQKPQLTDIKKIVTETLRFDPPVHNTRRVAINDIFIGDKIIKKGQSILVVMAAANLDPAVFNQPLLFNIERINNEQHLTFGLGGHHCLAKYLSIDMAVQACSYLVDNYRKIAIVQNEFNYEPQLNVRLVKELMINLS